MRDHVVQEIGKGTAGFFWFPARSAQRVELKDRRSWNGHDWRREKLSFACTIDRETDTLDNTL